VKAEQVSKSILRTPTRPKGKKHRAKPQRSFLVSRVPCYCDHITNITVSVDEDTYRRARIKAAEQGTSVSALVKNFLVALSSEESDARRLEREERELRAHIRAFTAGNRLSRDDVHRRDK
jgi:plasmid stability protein